MDTIFNFLKDINEHNDREWFNANRAYYEKAREKFTALAEEMIAKISAFDPAVAGIPVKDTLYRFYRDTRFSPDKSPYKRHFGSYINPHGKKSLHGGYYLHLQPGQCLIAVGAYALPSNVLKAVRWSIVNEKERFHTILTEPELAALHPVMGETHLKTCPAGFPRDFAYPEYLRPREYDLSVPLPDAFFRQKDLTAKAAHVFRLLKPFLDFVNETVDDYI